MNCTSTHDTKRGEDGRIRINIISELTEEWAALVAKWQKINEPYRQPVGDLRAPLVNDEYFLYQAITGGFPENLELTEEFVTRTKTYFIKVLRESKQNSDHVNPNIAYEEASLRFIEHLLNPDHAFLPSIREFVKKLIPYANIYTMVQVIIKITAPGIPDIYRGCELWDISYVDPDNRRPVDYILRQKMVNEMKQQQAVGPAAVLEWANEHYETGAQKFFVTRTLLRIRREKKDLFLKGEYIPIYAPSDGREVIAFIRRYEEDWLLVILPLAVVANTGRELTISLPEGAPAEWANVFTGETVNGPEIDVHQLYKQFPVAVLQPSDAKQTIEP
jgi:(1->4)-alpha-D-glucan 1-alpha-D-glucosylmutase